MTTAVGVAIIADTCDDHISCTIGDNSAWIVSTRGATVLVAPLPQENAIGRRIFHHEASGNGVERECADDHVPSAVHSHYRRTRRTTALDELLLPERLTVCGRVLCSVIGQKPVVKKETADDGIPIPIGANNPSSAPLTAKAKASALRP